MYRSGREQRRAAMTAGASFVVGALLIATAAIGGIVTSSQADTSSSSSTARAAIDDTTGALSGVGPGQGAAVGVGQGTAGVAGAPGSTCVDAGGSIAAHTPGAAAGGTSQNPGDARRTALLIGDSQSSGAAGVSGENTWTQAGLRGAGYDVQFLGAGGTGFVATNSSGGLNYAAALAQSKGVLPCEDPALIVVEGGGNDATQGASDAQILAGADMLVSDLSNRYPTSKIVLVGTLAKDAENGGGRRTAVDGLLGTYARDHGIEFVSVGNWLTKYHADVLMADAVHLTQAGHDRLAPALTSQLEARHLTPGQLSTVG